MTTADLIFEGLIIAVFGFVMTALIIMLLVIVAGLVSATWQDRRRKR